MDLDVTLKTQTIEVEITNTTFGLPSATAENDVIVANSSLSWVKKTLAQLKTLLGIGIPFGQFSSMDGAITLDGTVYKDYYGYVVQTAIVNLTNVSDGDAGMIILIVDAFGGYTLTMGSMFTKQVGSTTFDDPVVASDEYTISWRKCTTNIYYTINKVV